MSYFSKKEVPLVLNEERRIVLLGKVGVGKSASGNTILGMKDLFPSKCSLSALTTKCQKEMGNIGSQHVVVVDTPGLFNINKTNEEVVTEIKGSMSLARPGPHVFLIVLKISNKYTNEDKEVVDIIRSTFGKHTMAYVMILFTCGDQLKGASIDDFIRSNGNLHSLIKQCEWRCHVFNNEVEGGDQVQELLVKINDMVSQAAERPFYTAEVLQEAEIASAKQVQHAAAGGGEGGGGGGGGGQFSVATIQTSAYAGIGIGCLVGYLITGGEVTTTMGVVLGGVVGGVLSSVLTCLVILACKQKCC